MSSYSQHDENCRRRTVLYPSETLGYPCLGIERVLIGHLPGASCVMLFLGPIHLYNLLELSFYTWMIAGQSNTLFMGTRSAIRSPVRLFPSWSITDCMHFCFSRCKRPFGISCKRVYHLSPIVGLQLRSGNQPRLWGIRTSRTLTIGTSES